jgi:hypothetical protein
MSGGAPWADHELNLTVQNVKESYELAEALPGVCGIKESIQLWHGSGQAPRQFSTAQARLLHPAPGFDREFMNHEFSQVARVLVVLQRVFDVY